jgi:hypothetical protein
LENYDLLGKLKRIEQEDNEFDTLMGIDPGERQIRRPEGLLKSRLKRRNLWPSLQVRETEGWIPKSPIGGEGSQKIVYGAFFYTSTGAFTVKG